MTWVDGIEDEDAKAAETVGLSEGLVSLTSALISYGRLFESLWRKIPVFVCT